MQSSLPWITYVLVLASLLIRREKQVVPARGGLFGLALLPIAVTIGAAVVGWTLAGDKASVARDALYGLAAGSVLSILATFLRPGKDAAFSLSLAAAALASTHFLLPSALTSWQLGMAAGACLTAWVLCDREGVSAGAVGFSVALAAGVTVELLALSRGNELLYTSGSWLLAVGAAAIIIMSILGRAASALSPEKPFGILVAIAIAGTGGWYLLTKTWTSPDAQGGWIAGLACALAVAWLLAEQEAADGFRVLLSSVIWISLATLAFGLDRGFGMALALVGGVIGAIASGRMQALISLASLATLTIYRVFRELFPDASRALDIGQHYGLIGLLVGALVPLIAFEWRRRQSDRPTGMESLGLAIWSVALMASPAMVALMLSEKGVVGFLVGLGLAPAIALRGDSGPLRVLPISVGLSAWTCILYTHVSHLAVLTRDEKLAMAWKFGGALLILGLFIVFLAPKPKQVQA